MDKEEEFIQGLYDEANNQLNEVYKEQKANRDDLLSEIAGILLTYTIVNDIMGMSKQERSKEYNRLSKIIVQFSKGQAKLTESVITEILTNTTINTFDFYSYNAKLKDVQDIINNNFKGKHFSDRVWDNETKVAKHLHKQVNDFLQGKVNVNQIKKDIEKTFNNSAYEVKRLVETEVNRCEDESFRRFCRETGVTKVKRNEVLDSKICSQCAELDGQIYNLDNAPGVVHPLCRGFNTIAEDKSNKTHKIGDNSKDNENIRNSNNNSKGVQGCIDRMDKLGVHNVDLKHINNSEVLNPFTDELERLKNEYGLMFNRIESIDISENTIAQVKGRVLQLNQRYFNDKELLQKQLDDWARGKFIPKGCNNIEYVSNHEYFHLLTQDEIDNPKSKVRAIFNRADNKDFVSKNAVRDAHEFAADSLAVNRLKGITNKSINKLLKIFGGD